jgi:hypothetical protein
LSKLNQHSNSQQILMNTILDKMLISSSTNGNVSGKLLDTLLSQSNSKRALFAQIRAAIMPREHDLHQLNNQSTISTSWFLKHQLLAKYDIVPSTHQFNYLASFVGLWHWRASGGGGYVSAATIRRYLSARELVTLVLAHLTYLIRNGFVNEHTRLNQLINLAQEIEEKGTLSCVEEEVVGNGGGREKWMVKSPMSLKLAARNVVRKEIRSLCDRDLQSLQLPLNLIEYLKVIV